VTDPAPAPDEAVRYAAVTDRVGGLYEQQEYVAALAVVDSERGSLPGYLSDLAHLAACLHALAGDPVAALRELRDAAAVGAWWHPRLLLDDDDLDAVRGLPGFDDLVAEARVRSAAAQAAVRDLPPVVRRPSTPHPHGLLVVLHGAGQDAADAAARWSAAVDHGFLLAAVDSSQLSTPTYRTWPDQAAAAADIGAALETLEPADRALPVVAAGFSAGARAALLWSTSGSPVDVAGVVAVSPAIWPQQTAQVGQQPVGVVLIGSADDLLATTQSALELLPGVRLEVVEGLAHDYPHDFDGWLQAALDEVLPQP
jgi:dienelactone hydrolase